MSQGANFVNHLSALHREMDSAKEEVRVLEQRQSKIRRQIEDKWRSKSEAERLACHQPNTAGRIAEIRQEHHLAIAPAVAELTQVKEKLRSLNQKINEKRQECQNLVRNY